MGNHLENLSVAVKMIIITVSLSELKQLTAPVNSFIAKGTINCLSPGFPAYLDDLYNVNS